MNYLAGSRSSSRMYRHNFPFHAVVGEDNAKLAVILSCIIPERCSILLAGKTGTAKSLIARSTTHISSRSIVMLPVHATSERIFGAIDLEQTLRKGSLCAKPGLLAEADGKVLLIEDIHLASSSIVSAIFSAQETGYVILEREGISAKYQADFKILATASIEDGTLPVILPDRFDLCGTCETIRTTSDRIEIIRRIIMYERDNSGIASFTDNDRDLRLRIETARRGYSQVLIPEGLLDLISRVPGEMGVEGHRGEIALSRAAKAYAALHCQDQVTYDDILTVLPLAMNHRRREKPETPPPSPRENQSPENREESVSGEQNSGQEDKKGTLADVGQGTADRSPGQQEMREEKDEETVFPVTPVNISKPLFFPANRRVRTHEPHAGKKGNIRCKAGKGRHIRSVQPSGRIKDVAFDATIRVAAPFQPLREKNDLAVAIYPSDIREKYREEKTGRILLFVLDSSGSMGAAKRMGAVKGAILSLLKNAYINRDSVSLICFRGRSAEIIFPPSKSGQTAYSLLQDIPTGGLTPLSEAISVTNQFVRKIRQKRPGEKILVTLVSDGRANVSFFGGDPFGEAIHLATAVPSGSAEYLVIDTECGFPRLGMAKKLALALRAHYVRLENLEADSIVSVVRETARLIQIF